MRLIRGLYNLPKNWSGCALTIGNFDGVHLGHQAILEKLCDKAAEIGMPSVVLLFEPQPAEFFAQKQSEQLAPARLMRLRDKLNALRFSGVDYVLCVRFDTTFAGKSAVDFIRELLVEKLKARYVSIGDDFRFGANRTGDFELLRNAGLKYRFAVEDSHSHRLDNQRISSSLIREALAQDNLTLANQLLGKAYCIGGRVAHGNKLGRTIGFPTANILLNRLVTPIQGVYAVQVETPKGKFNGIANVGNRPTVNGSKPLLEVHLFDFSGDLYGKTLRVTFVEKIRNEIKFANVEALKAQIMIDVEKVRSIFSEN